MFSLTKSKKKKIKRILLWVTGIELVRHLIIYILDAYLILRNQFIVFSIDYGIGDQVCMTALVDVLANQKHYKVVVVSDFFELYEGSNHVYKNIKYKTLSTWKKKFLKILLHTSKGRRIQGFYSKRGIAKVCAHEEYKDISLIELHSIDFSKRYNLNLKNSVPFIKFTKEEKDRFKLKFSDLPSEYAVIMPSANTNYTPNKAWKFERFQQVVGGMQGVNWVQTGGESEVLLQSVIDLRGRTETIKELAYIVSKAKFILTTEGLLNHLSAAFEVPSFVIFSGFHHIDIANYSNTIPIHRHPQIDCAPCYLTTPCPRKTKYCTEDISVEKVLSEIEKFIE